MPISLAQQKLIASDLRMRILHQTSIAPMTAKQVAQALGETPGNIHYHLQRLLDGGLVELTATRPVKGIVEKYYRAKATRFRIVHEGDPARPLRSVAGYMRLTDAQQDEMLLEVAELLHRWQRAMSGRPAPGSAPRRIELTVTETETEPN